MRRTIALLLLASALLGACRSGAGVDSEHDDTEESSLTAVAQEAAELVEEGKALLEDDRCQAAVEPLTRAIELQPDLPDAHLALGNAYDRSLDCTAQFSTPPSYLVVSRARVTCTEHLDPTSIVCWVA